MPNRRAIPLREGVCLGTNFRTLQSAIEDLIGIYLLSSLGPSIFMQETEYRPVFSATHERFGHELQCRGGDPYRDPQRQFLIALADGVY